ncbi:subtilase [Marseilla massiliensis]|uniref:Subtilase n=1 Tax=Marseilla massiliensis TaxID=1841864 RepID=A0A939B6F0_9BACT|nr:subtilase [Marseilla massiliensis]MBM6672475.1 subtilase [Marseilla massiliensis]
MKRKALCAFLMLGLSGGVAMADTEHTVTVNGEAIDGFITELTFNGDQVTMKFEDGSTQTDDMSLVSIALTYSETSTGITEIETDDQSTVKRVYTISGQYVGTSTEGLPQGIYIVNGKKTIVK